ncbi:MAG: hypothetical protein GY948_13340 [Alphaproteobacteria bacterium]|nr:hypothetical protein [Alphaproteobacteria bacterium]
MAKGNVVAGLSEEQYAEIELAVMESARGRTFLREFLARNRSADTRMLLDAISRLESALCLKAIEREGGEQFTPALAEIASVVTATRTEIAAIRNDLIAGGGALAQGPEAFTTAAEQANLLSAELLSQVEQVENLAWKIRELGVESDICDKLDVCVEDLMTLCWKQDVNGQRAAKALSVLQFVNDRTGGNLVSVGGGAAGDEAEQDALCAPSEPEAVNTSQDAYFAEDVELFSENPEPAAQAVPQAPAPGLTYAETTAEDPLSSDEIVAETTSTDEIPAEPETIEPVETAETTENTESEVPSAPSTMTASALMQAPTEMIGPANMKGFNEMAASIDAPGPFNSTTLAQMVTPAQEPSAEEAPAGQGGPQAESTDPFQVELDRLAKKDGFAFNPEENANTPSDAAPVAEEQASSDDEDGNGHIVIIRTPSEPDVNRLPEAITQEKPAEDGEVPMVEISPPAATSA